VSTIDFFPTVMELSGTKSEVLTDGVSILPLIKGMKETSLDNRTLYWHYPHYYPTTTPVSAIREGNWKLIEFLEDGHTELYNLADDMSENHNLVHEEPQVAKALLEKLHKWKENTGAQGIVPNPNFQSK
jgi:arylsulfatase A-like enzyme